MCALIEGCSGIWKRLVSICLSVLLVCGYMGVIPVSWCIITHNLLHSFPLLITFWALGFLLSFSVMNEDLLPVIQAFRTPAIFLKQSVTYHVDSETKEGATFTWEEITEYYFLN
jgi:hypothetical protein